MAFIKIKDKKNVEAIINTDMIYKIAKVEAKNGYYFVFFSNGSRPYEYDHNEIKKIFDAIGESLDW